MYRDDHSFIVPAYKDSPFLPDCLRSLSSQSVASRVVITTSTPSAYIAQVARDAGVELIINPDSKGIGADWNFGLESAGTRYVTLAHQDDVYRPAFLERTLSLFERYPTGALVFTGYDEIADDGCPRHSKLTVVKQIIKSVTIGRREAVAGARRGLLLSFGCPIPCSSVTLDMEQFPRFRFSTVYKANLDWDAWWWFHQQNATFLHCAERLVGHRHNDLTETISAIRSGVRLREDREMFERIWPRPISRTLALLYRSGY
jgi:glycosyltransferase involved in cell wall biosynthesis